MKQTTWKKHHSWLGIIFCIFIIFFCVSGILLNHRHLIGNINISRKYIPKEDGYTNWNNGLIRGDICYKDSVLIFGNGGIWETDSLGKAFNDFNKGLPKGMDFRDIKRIIRTKDSIYFAISQFNLYRLENSCWKKVSLRATNRLSSICVKDDSIFVVSRSAIFTSKSPYKNFQRLELKAYKGYDGKISMFRTIWMLHSGEVLGLPGRLIIDTVAVILIILCITGIIYWLSRLFIKKKNKQGEKSESAYKMLKSSYKLHLHLGRYAILLLLFVTITGFFLRPPMLIAIIKMRVPAIPHTELSSKNPWNDKLRDLRFDKDFNDWIIYSSEGYFSLKSLTDIPLGIENTPPTSIMGINVWQRNDKDNWLVGSFSGLFSWNRKTGSSIDYFTGKEAEHKAGPPFGAHAITGFCNYIAHKRAPIEYGIGSDFVPMPDKFKAIPISLWRLCLEIHTGRIFTFLGFGRLLYIFISGIIIFWIIISGYKIALKTKKKQKKS